MGAWVILCIMFLINIGVLVATAITISFISGTSDGADGLIGHWKLQLNLPLMLN